MGEQSRSLYWSLISECQMPKSLLDLLVPGEITLAAYNTFRDHAALTNRRIIVKGPQGRLIHNNEIISLPYTSITMWTISEETEEDGITQILLRTMTGNITINMNKHIDTTKFYKLLSGCLLKK